MAGRVSRAPGEDEAAPAAGAGGHQSPEPRSGLILISSRYMAGRVSRAPGADEAPVLEGLAVIKAQSCALD